MRHDTFLLETNNFALFSVAGHTLAQYIIQDLTKQAEELVGFEPGHKAH